VADDAVQILRFLGRENRGGLVENEETRSAVDELEYLHTLLLTHAQLPNRCPGVHFQPVSVGELPNPGAHVFHPGHEGKSAHTQDDVLGHGHGIHEHEVLVYHADTERRCITGRVDLHAVTVHENLTLVWSIQAHEYVHERALPCTVFTEEREYFTTVQLQVDPFISQYAWEMLGDAPHLDRRNVCFYTLVFHMYME